MNKYVEKVGNYIINKTQQSPESARKLLETIYSGVRFTKTHNFYRDVRSAYEYMTGVIAGTISDSFRHPERAVMVNIFFPCEILHAMNLTPMFPEGTSCYLACTGCQSIFAQTAEDNDVPETFCSYHKTMVGLAETGVMPKPLMIANTTLACDANQLSFRRLAEDYDVPHKVIDIPNTYSEDTVMYVADQLRELTPMLEDLSHQKLDEEKLREVMNRAQRTMRMYRKFINRRNNLSLPSYMSGEMTNMISTHMMLGTKESEIYNQKLLKATRKHPLRQIKDSKKRIFWVHTLPNWQESMTNIFEKSSNVEIVGTDMGVDGLFDIDPEKPYESMARRVVGSFYNGKSKNRIEATLKYAKDANADGIVLFCHWGCKQTLGLSQMAKQKFESEGIPTLVLDGDGCDARNVADGQMVTRVNAFIEQLEGFNV